MDALQKLVEMAWPLLDPLARDEIVADQFLNELDSHKLGVRVAAMGVRRIEDLMRIMRSLEAVEGHEASHGWQQRGSTQTQFLEEEESDMEAARIAEQILVKLGPEFRQSRDPKRRPPTPGPQRVRSVEREAPSPVPKDISKNKSADKTVECNR